MTNKIHGAMPGQAAPEYKSDTTTVYSHPDGFTLAFNDNVLTATDDEDNTVCIPIGPLGLIALGELLTAIGRNRGTTGEGMAA